MMHGVRFVKVRRCLVLHRDPKIRSAVELRRGNFFAYSFLQSKIQAFTGVGPIVMGAPAPVWFASVDHNRYPFRTIGII